MPLPAPARAAISRALTNAEIYLALKARDPREPGRRRKAEYEARLAALFRKYFRAQRTRIDQQLQLGAMFGLAVRASPLAAVFGDGFWKGELDQLIAELTALLGNAARDGVALFGEQTRIGLDYTLTNDRAADWARSYAFDLIKDINDKSRAALQGSLERFVLTPGQTLGDVIKSLPYPAERAETIAVTEITRAYSQAAQVAGQQLQEEFPDVQVVKRWFTNNDGLVCPICRPLNNTAVPLDDDFPGEIAAPPAHPNCRCWTTTTTRLAR